METTLNTQTTSSLIIEDIARHLLSTPATDRPSLYAGTGGVCLFYAYLYKATGREIYGDKALELLEGALQYLENDYMPDSLCYGFTGVAWLVQHLTHIGFLTPEDTVSLLEDFDRHVAASLPKDKTMRNYDLLEGALGKGVYLLERGSQGEQLLAAMVDLLDSCAESQATGLTWEITFEKPYPDKPAYSLGLAHGIPSIIAFLSRVYQKNIATEKTRKLLEGAIRWMLAQEAPVGASLFPSLHGSLRESRLGWCYGDLGIAVAFWQAAVALDDEELKQHALRIALHTTSRKLENSQIRQDASAGLTDAGFCHGVSGILHLYHRLYTATKHPAFAESMNYWQNLLEQIRTDCPDNLAGYVKLTVTPEQALSCKGLPGLIEGVSGIGLVLLTIESPIVSTWDSIFLTDLS